MRNIYIYISKEVVREDVCMVQRHIFIGYVGWWLVEKKKEARKKERKNVKVC